MKTIIQYYKYFEKTVSNVKFAVVIISTFALALTYGTFMESYHGTEYANRLVYKSWWFILIECLMFVSIFMATVVRLPIKKRLYGFYTIHSGLMILFIGAFFTYINGIDGSIQLLPNTPAHKIMVNEDLLKIEFSHLKKVYSYKLPYLHSAGEIDKSINNIKILKYLPFAENKIKWVENKEQNPEHHSSTFLLFNENMSQEITMSLSPDSDFKSMLRMGLLNLHYMPLVLKNCFTSESASGFIVWNLESGECFAAEERKLDISKTSTGNRFMLIKHAGGYLKFFPDFSPVPVNDDLTKNNDSPFRVLSKQLFEDKPNLFIFGNFVAFFDKIEKKWTMHPLENSIVNLPWMGFKMRTLAYSQTAYPVEIPVYTKPTQEDGKIIKGDMKAVEISFYGKNYWVTNISPVELSNGKEKVRFIIEHKEIDIPYQITLDRFQMNTNPGTTTPASFESFVQLLDSNNTGRLEKHHIFMNNPLKYDDFTYYQSSYFPIGENQYGSVLSVNYDPGRFFKYLGSFLIVFGSIWHYILNRKKKIPTAINNTEKL